MKRVILSAMCAALAAAAPVIAHEGHAHKVMGTVCAAHATYLEIAAADGKTATVRLTENTRIVRGGKTMHASDIRSGDRVVATATETKGKDGKASLIASRIQLGVAGEPCVPESRPRGSASRPPVP